MLHRSSRELAALCNYVKKRRAGVAGTALKPEGMKWAATVTVPHAFRSRESCAGSTVYIYEAFHTKSPQKMTQTNFQIFWKISLVVMVEIIDLTLRGVVDSFEIYIVNSLITKNLFYSVQSFIWGSTTKTKKILLLLLKEVLGYVNHVFNNISSFKHKPLFRIFNFTIIFFVFDDIIDLGIWRWRIEAHQYTFKKSSQKWKFWMKVHVS